MNTKILVASTCDSMLQDIHGSIDLHYAVLSGHLEMVKFLIEELKCTPDIIGLFNMTPLQLAIAAKHSSTAQYLQK